MAKFECDIVGNYNDFLDQIERGILKGSVSASYENGADYSINGVRCAVRVYERYSVIGNNRVSMSLTVIGSGSNIRLIAITSGGSQAVFFKINTLGEEAFLDSLKEVVIKYQNRQQRQ